MKVISWVPSYLVICCAVCLAAPAARGDDTVAARLHYNQGTKAFDLGLYDKAIAEYMTAYQAVNDPALLYNLAQAHRLAGHVRDALRFYRVYLQRLPGAENRPEVEQKIMELKQAADRLDRAQNGLQPDRPLDPGVEPGAPTPPPVVATENAVVVARPEQPGRTLRLAGIGTGAAGVAGLAVGIAFGALAQSASSSLTSTSRNGGFYDPGKYSSGHTDQIVEGVTLGIGAAAVATGVVLYVLGRRAALHARDVAWLR
jgi:tetratricopeptide (TPR) repeat protein